MALHKTAGACGKPLFFLQYIAGPKKIVTLVSFSGPVALTSGTLKGNKPRQIADGTCLIFCPTSGRTLDMGFRPLFSFNFKRRTGLSGRALAPHQAKPGLFSGGVSSIKGTSCKRVSPAGIQDCVSRVIPAPGNPVSTGSIAKPLMAYRLGLRAMGTLGKSCDSRNLFSRQQNPAPETAQRQPQTFTEIVCEGGNGTAQ